MPLHILLALTSKLYHAVNIYFSFLFLSYVSDKLQRASLHNLSCYIYDIVLSFARHTCVHTCLRGRARTNRAQRYKKKSTLAREMPKKRKNIFKFFSKRGVWQGNMTSIAKYLRLLSPHLSDYEGEEHKKDCGIAGEPLRRLFFMAICP